MDQATIWGSPKPIKPPAYKMPPKKPIKYYPTGQLGQQKAAAVRNQASAFGKLAKPVKPVVSPALKSVGNTVQKAVAPLKKPMLAKKPLI